MVTVHVTPSTGTASTPLKLTGLLIVHFVESICVMHEFSPGQPPAGLVQGPAGMVVGNVPGAHTGGLPGQKTEQRPPTFAAVQVPVPLPVQQAFGLLTPAQKLFGLQVPVPAPVQQV